MEKTNETRKMKLSSTERKSLCDKQQQNYFLSHSVGLPFAGMKDYFDQHYFSAWHNDNEPWPNWIGGINEFRQQLATLLNAEMDELCPQSNLSSGLTKLIYSLPKPDDTKNVILCSAEDFPSMAFVLQKAETLGYQLKLFPEQSDLHDLNLWQQYLTDDVAICLVTQVQSNNGCQLPVQAIVHLCRKLQIRSIVDVAQGIGLLEIDTKAWNADFILGSCVKWLCGGPGAAFMWVNPDILELCQPVDVGWFSHSNPFEFDIRHFDYANSALRFWGGTPTVAPYIHAAYAISKVNDIGVKTMRDINYGYLQQIHAAIAKVNPAFIKSPLEREKCSGTVIIHFGAQQAELISRLKASNIAFDERPVGIRLSPHYYTSDADLELLLACF